MSNEKTPDAMQRAMQDALASVERIERERTGSSDDAGIETELELPDPSEASQAPANNGPGDDDVEQTSDDAPEELEKVRAQMLRLAADFENFRKRSQREREEVRQFGIEGVLRDLLSVVDNLDRALDHTDDDDNAFVQGVRMIGKQLVDAIAAHGAKPFESVGQPFDPERHEAMSQAPSNEVAPGMVLHELEKGYWLHERLLRPAKVIVAIGQDPEPEDAAQSSQHEADEETDGAQE